MTKLSTDARVSVTHSVAEQLHLSFTNSDLADDANLTNIFGNLEIKMTAMTEAIKHSKAESDLAEKDEARDFVIRGIASSLQSAQFSFDASVQTAYVTLNRIFEKYGVIMAGESYAIESSLIKAFLQDVSTTEAEAAIAVIPFLSDLIARLASAQTDFDNAENVWNAAKSTDTVSSTALKKELFDIINNQVVAYLTALSAINTDYKSLASQVEEIIETANRNIKRK